MTATLSASYSRSQQAYLKLAAKLALLSSVVQRHGAVVVKGGSVIAGSWNSYSNDPRLFPTDYFNGLSARSSKTARAISVHAEIAALRKASPSQLRGSTVYIARMAPTGELAYSAPCAACAEALAAAGVKRVIYTS